jgi:outer membrane protein
MVPLPDSWHLPPNQQSPSADATSNLIVFVEFTLWPAPCHWLGRRKKMLRITIHENGKLRRLELAGKLAGEWVAETEKAWQAAGPGAQLEIDLTAVTGVDEAGRCLLRAMIQHGATLIAKGLAMRALIDEVRCSDAAPITRASKRHPGGLAGVVLALMLLPAVRLNAQEAEREPLRLTLRDAVNIALKQNPQVAIANLNLAQSQESRKIALSGLLPSASLDASQNVNRINPGTLVAGAIPHIPGHIGPFWTTQAGPSFSAPLLDLTQFEKWRASKENVKANEAEQLTAREENVQLVVSQYLGGLRAAADVTAAHSRLDLAKALLDLAADQQRQGVGTRIDTLRANVQYQNERQRLSDAQSQLKISLYGLSRLLNIDVGQPLELADAPSFFETPAVNTGETIAAAYEQRPELKAILAQVKEAELQKRAASAERLPKLSIAGDWTLDGLTPSTMIPAYSIGAAFQVPLFTGGRIKAETTTADLEIKKLQQSAEDLRNQIAQEVKTALAQLDAGRVSVEAAGIGVSEANEEVTEAEDRFRAGIANNIEITTAQDDLARANDNQIAALYEYNQARADLARATGSMEALYAK